MSEIKWISFEEELPNIHLDECVLLFSYKLLEDKEFPGIPFEVSNPQYARTNAQKNGYTHWCRVPYPLPNLESKKEAFTKDFYNVWNKYKILELSDKNIDLLKEFIWEYCIKGN